MSDWNLLPRQLVLAVFSVFIASFSISINGELQSRWISKNRPERYVHLGETTEEPPYQFTTTENSFYQFTTEKPFCQYPTKKPSYQFTTTKKLFYHPKTMEGGLDSSTTTKDPAQISPGGISGSLKNGTASSPNCVHTKEEAYCQRVLIIAILLVTFTIVSSALILGLFQYYHLRKYTFYLNDAILPNQGNSACTALNGLTVKEVAL